MDTKEFQKTILAQYANSTILLKLLESMNITIDPMADIDKIFLHELDLDTCGTHGLDVWGIIVAAPRVIYLESDEYFGYKGSLLQPFNSAPFYYGDTKYNTHTLSNEAYRKLIYFKAACNIVHTTLPRIAELLRMIFSHKTGRWDVYVLETGVMTMRVVLRMTLSPVERAILRTYGPLLRPGGVGIEFRELPYELFGYDGQKLQPFNTAPFYLGNMWTFDEINDEREALNG